MAKITHGAAIFKDAQGNTIKVQGLTENDITKIKKHGTDIEAIQQKISRLDEAQSKIAFKDFYTDETHKADMAPGVFYMVPFNAADEYLEWDEATGKPKAGQMKPAPNNTQPKTDLKVAYFQIVMKNSNDQVNKLGKQEVQPNFEDFAKLKANNKFTADNTFEKDITVNAAQDVDTLGDKKLATAKFVKDLTDKKITEAGHLKGKFHAAGVPDEGALKANEIVFYKAQDLLA